MGVGFAKIFIKLRADWKSPTACTIYQIPNDILKDEKQKSLALDNEEKVLRVRCRRKEKMFLLSTISNELVC